ncbi:dihydroorotase, multifunctional complex type [Desulfitobacterium dichloroeliminans LMG P-21439]|uniref:Dihydroorotase, multifunctional complex type n=1 Tax=Desulfitobacterium dichloroeliminans (strain LMG P-21439 / DCA1) TaxID=871963 RepID=L0F4V4_DESDL|nr:dihydroorotase [Desulfitobacterium dichloroeliminans]AGA68045.1 dihydroorotase, multifunctional complex type [Desulfitobacterium dichloroeliminans LMG P-21439]
MYDLQIVNAKIVTEQGKIDGCITINNGKIEAISSTPLVNAKETIDAKGLFVLPGFIDQHVHFMDLGESEREDYIHGTTAAAMAGVTTVIEHTHSRPILKVEDFSKYKEYFEQRALVDFGFAAHIWPGQYEELEKLWQEGVSYFKMFTCTTHGVPGQDNASIYGAFSKVASFGGSVLVHCEDEALTAENEKILKENNREDGHVIQEWRSKDAEAVSVANVCFIAKETGARVTIAHLSHPDVVRTVLQAKASGANVLSEICPQYLYLEENTLAERGSFGKFTPPSRSAQESEELMELVGNGDLDILASDHAPSTKQHKTSGSIWKTPFGLPGIDTTSSVMLTAVNKGKLSLERFVQMYSENPAKALGLYPKKGCIRVGADADLVLVDMERQWTIQEDSIQSKAKWTPFEGFECIGKAVMTLLRGQVIMSEGQLLGKPGDGKYVKRA